jgi:hypothetical protein
MKPRSPNKILTGVAGEYFVAAELSRRGYVATLTLSLFSNIAGYVQRNQHPLQSSQAVAVPQQPFALRPVDPDRSDRSAA